MTERFNGRENKDVKDQNKIEDLDNQSDLTVTNHYKGHIRGNR